MSTRWPRNLDNGIFAHLSPFVGDKPGERVRVTVAEGEGGQAVASIQVAPTFKIQDKSLEFQLGLPLR